MTTPDVNAAFEAATSSLEALSPMAAMWAEAREELARDGIDLTSENIGRHALYLLPECEEDEGMAELFFAFDQCAAREALELEQRPLLAQLLPLLAAFRTCTRYNDPIPDTLLHDIARLAGELHGEAL